MPCSFQVFVCVDSRKGLSAFLPTALQIVNAVDAESIRTQRSLDSEFHFNLLVVESCLTSVSMPVEHIRPYLEDLKECLRKTLHAEDKALQKRTIFESGAQTNLQVFFTSSVSRK